MILSARRTSSYQLSDEGDSLIVPTVFETSKGLIVTAREAVGCDL